MELTLEHIAEEVWTLKGAYNGISADVKEIKADGKDLYKKTERDKTELKDDIRELFNKTERDKTELIERIAKVEYRMEKMKTEIITKLIIWMVGLQIGFGALLITALWAILNFAIKN